ncbi:hypothetical protein BRC88_03190 [Halobacteriales archaeon QS_4_69_225]|nr:MAG: hypothetical protein BRC88_03190 [Halobacteriales archaeon QS_4_69_225]
MSEGGIVNGIRVDVVRLHETWMELVFPRQRTAVHRVLGKWKPRTRADEVKYYLWGALGVPLVALLYPLLLVGVAVRFNARRFDSASTRLGVVGVVVLAALVWGLLTAAARIRFDEAGFVAVAAASTVAVVSAGLAAVFKRVGGRATTVAFAYPFAMNAIFLPPVVAALYDPALGVVIERSTELAEFFRDDVFVGPLDPVSDYLSDRFDFEGVVVALMWFCIATPLGWLLGLLVTLANLVRPKSVEEQVEAEQT